MPSALVFVHVSSGQKLGTLYELPPISAAVATDLKLRASARGCCMQPPPAARETSPLAGRCELVCRRCVAGLDE